MPSGNETPQEPQRQFRNAEVEAIFDDFEAKTNVVGLYDLLLKIDRRTRPDLYEFRGETGYD